MRISKLLKNTGLHLTLLTSLISNPVFPQTPAKQISLQDLCEHAVQNKDTLSRIGKGFQKSCNLDFDPRDLAILIGINPSFPRINSEKPIKVPSDSKEILQRKKQIFVLSKENKRTLDDILRPYKNSGGAYETMWLPHIKQVLNDYGDTIKNATKMYHVPLDAYLAVVGVECGNPYTGYSSICKAQSPTGARGISQIFSAAIIEASKFTGKKEIKNSPLYSYQGISDFFTDYVNEVYSEELKEKAIEIAKAKTTKPSPDTIGAIKYKLTQKKIDELSSPYIQRFIEDARDISGNEYNIKLNIYAGIAYLRYLYETKAGNNWSVAVQMYNSGPNVTDLALNDYFKKTKVKKSLRKISFIDVFNTGSQRLIQKPADNKYSPKVIGLTRALKR